jgi:hypothetical protein
MGSGAMHFVHDERGGCWCGVFWCQDVFEMIGGWKFKVSIPPFFYLSV